MCSGFRWVGTGRRSVGLRLRRRSTGNRRGTRDAARRTVVSNLDTVSLADLRFVKPNGFDARQVGVCDVQTTGLCDRRGARMPLRGFAFADFWLWRLDLLLAARLYRLGGRLDTGTVHRAIRATTRGFARACHAGSGCGDDGRQRARPQGYSRRDAPHFSPYSTMEPSSIVPNCCS